MPPNIGAYTLPAALEAMSKNHLRRRAKLQQKKYRDSEGLYIISGFRAVQGAFAQKQLRIKELIITERWKPWFEKQVRERPYPVFLAIESDFMRMSDESHPQGIALVAAIPPHPSLLPKDVRNPVLYLHEISDPGNLGTIIRTSYGFASKHVLLSPNSADAYQPKSVRASSGYIAGLEIHEDITPPQLQNLKETQGFRLLAASAVDGIPLHEIQVDSTPTIIMFGSEARGLSPELENLCDAAITIPCRGESLNLAVAVGIVLWHFQMALPYDASENHSSRKGGLHE